MHEELCLAWLIEMSPLKSQDIRNCNAVSHCSEIFCGCSARTFHSYLLSLGWTPAAQRFSIIWLTKIKCRSCVPRDASCLENHCTVTWLPHGCILYSFWGSTLQGELSHHYTPQRHIPSVCCTQSRPRRASLCIPTTCSPAALCAPAFRFQGPERQSISTCI